MGVDAAIALFLVMLALSLAALELGGGAAACFLSVLLFLVGLVMKRVGDRRIAAEEAQRAEGEGEEAEALRRAPGLDALRVALGENGFGLLHACLLPSIGRYAEILARGETYAEIVVDEENPVPVVAFRTFFRDGSGCATETALVRFDPPPAASAGEHHWLPGAATAEALAFHDGRVAALVAAGREPERRERSDYGSERARSLGDTKRVEGRPPHPAV